MQYFLAKGDNSFPIKQDEILDGAYRVEALTPEEVTLLYVPLGVLTQLPLALSVDRSTSLAQTPTPAPDGAASTRVATASQVPLSSTPPPRAGQALASETNDLSRTAATGTRAAHLRRERSQQLPHLVQ